MPIKKPGGNKEEKNNPNAFKNAAKNAGASAWKKARKEAPRPAYGEMLPKGRYETTLRKIVCDDQDFEMDMGKNKKQKIKIPRLRFEFEVSSGDYKGAIVSKFIRLRPESVENSEYDYLDLSDTFQKLGKDIDSTDLSGIPDLAEELTSENPGVMIYADIRSYKDRNGQDQQIQNIRVNSLLEEPGDDSEEGQEEQGEESGDELTAEDVTALGEAADTGGDEQEQAEADLRELCEQLEIDPDQYEDWASVAEAINNAFEGEEEQEEEAEEEPEEEKPQPRKVVKKKPASKPAAKPAKKKKK
jgi:hypothetical protein